jgi:hypothetical protein
MQLGISDAGIRRIAEVIVEDYLWDDSKDWVFHTSPVEITEIREPGYSPWDVFGDVFFFSTSPYSLDDVDKTYIYRMNLPPDEVIHVSDLLGNFSEMPDEEELTILQPIIEEIQEIYGGVDEVVARKILTSADGATQYREDIQDQKEHWLNGDIEEPPNFSFPSGFDFGGAGWAVQALQGQAAKLLGYTAAESEDEQGTVYIVPMTGKLQDLELVETPEGG